MSQGMVYNIQRMSTKDGPGIRTTVFRKGCPLPLVQQSGIPDFFLSGAFFRQSLRRLRCVPDDLSDRSSSHERGCFYI